MRISDWSSDVCSSDLTEGLLQDLQRRLESLGNTDLPVGLGLREGDADGLGADAGIRWVEPDDAQQDDGRNRSSSLSFPTSFGPAQKTLESTARRVANAGTKAAGVSTAKAVYTIGRASGRDRGCRYGERSGVAGKGKN